MAKVIAVTPKQKAAAALVVKRASKSGRFVSEATRAIANAQPRARSQSATDASSA